jgi:transglycosylase-like protein with SLT domain
VTASGGERVALVEAVMPFLDEWQGLLKDVRRLVPERVNGMLDRAERLRKQADLAGQGGIVHHLEVCIECLKAPALDRRGFQEALRNLSEVTWQLKQELGPLPRRGPPGAEAGPSSFQPPPLLSDFGGGAPQVSSPAGVPPLVSRGGFEPPPPISLPGAPRAEPPPPEPRVQPPAAAREPPPLDRSRAALPQPPGAAAFSPPPRPFVLGGGAALPGAGARPPPPGHSAPPPPAYSAPPAPAYSAPPILAARGGAMPRAKEKPNLLVATMFGLRAFGRNKAPSAAAPPPARQPSQAPPQRGALLGLGRQQRSSAPSEAPAWIGPRAGGLPELGTGPSHAPLGGAPDDLDDRLRQLRGEEARPERRPSERPTGSRSGRPKRPSTPPGAEQARSGASRSSREPRPSHDHGGRSREGSFPIPWWIGGVAVALVGLVVVLLLVFGRSSPQAIAPQGTATPQPGEEPVMPTSRLLDDKERMRALMSLVHGYGGDESPELADLVNEEAALVYQVLEKSCDQPSDKCERPAPMVAGTVRSGATPQHEIHHLFEDRKIERSRVAAGQGPKWLAGLSTPAIGAQDDPNVRRWVEYYTSNQVGREEFQNMLFRCGAYQDLIEKTLVHYGMPRALLALVMTESGCVPHAESVVGARGLWQFMPATARAYHLHVTENVVDERISPPKSTEAAVKYLADLYRKMGSWEFALASYNMGPFGLAARIKRAGGDVTFWDLAASGSIPDETARYVPRIQAYAVILENLGHFNFSTAQMRATEVTAELEAPPGTRLGLVARAASTSLDHLKLLNPDIVGVAVPDLPGTNFMVQVPKEDVFRARTMLDQLLAGGDTSDRCVPSAFDWGSERFTEKMCDEGKPRRSR